MISSCHHQGDSYGFSGTAVFSAASLRFLFFPEGNLLGRTGSYLVASAGGGLDQTTSTEPSMVFWCRNKAHDDIKTKGCCNGLINLPDK